jgi:anionic cell wall polymer biosynthesis LytR-Cps2A-Psr (LCP) family protein
MAAADQVVENNLGININYVIRMRFEGFVDVINAMGGIDIDLPVDMSGLTAGTHHLDGTEALRFVRDRAGSDDFFRQQRGQMMIMAVTKKMINPLNWVRVPAVTLAMVRSIQSNIPLWVYPRLVYSSLFSTVYGIDAHTFDREMTTSWTTDAGAQVLLPNWEKINPLLYQLFRQ